MISYETFYSQTLHDCEAFISQDDATIEKGSIPPHIQTINNKLHQDFVESMSDDINTPDALAALSDPLKTINDLLHTSKVFILFPDCNHIS